MALSSVTLGTLVSDLRIRLNEISEEEFKDEELYRWLNLGCFDTAVQLTGISTHWFLTEAHLASPSGGRVSVLVDNTEPDALATNIIRLDRVYYDPDEGAAVTGRVLIPLVNIEELEGYEDNSILHPTADAQPGVVCAQWGEYLYFSNATWANILSGDELNIVYVKRPTKMTGPASEMDVPVEYQDLVISFAQVRAMQKKGIVQGRAQLQEDIENRIAQIRATHFNMLGYKDQLTGVREGMFPKPPTSAR